MKMSDHGGALLLVSYRFKYVLSHELVETITDPDGDAWYNTLNFSLFNQEIGDECVFVTIIPPNVFMGGSVVVDLERIHWVPSQNDGTPLKLQVALLDGQWGWEKANADAAEG
jgi:hypothetical protein